MFNNFFGREVRGALKHRGVDSMYGNEYCKLKKDLICLVIEKAESLCG